MKIRDWLLERNIKQTDFAERIGVGRCHFSCVVKGTRNAGRRLAEKIEKGTNGDIKANDVLTGEAVGYEGKEKRVPKGAKEIYKKDLPKNHFSLL